MSLSYNGRTVCDLNFKNLSGRPGIGIHRLSFFIEYVTSPWPDPGITLSEIRGTVTVQTLGTGTAPQLLGVVVPESPLVIEPRKESFTSQATLCIDLDPARVRAIEDVRNGGDLSFVVAISCAVVGSKAVAPNMAMGDLYFQVNQRTWIDALKQMGYGDFLLFEIPIPMPHATEELKQAVVKLTKAREHLWAGHYDEVVAACRVCLESITKGLKETDDMKNARNAYAAAGRKSMSQAERFLFLREAATYVAHTAHHTDETGASASFDRKDAICMLGVTAAILSRALSHHDSRKSDS